MTSVRLGLLSGLFLWTACAPPVKESLSDAEKNREVEAMYERYRAESFPDVPGVSVDGLLELRKDRDAVVVDAREPEEVHVSRIPGALTRQDFEARGDDLKDRPVVAYCTIGYRSGLYVAELRRRGFLAYNLEGSILAWTLAGEPLVDDAGEPTRRLHVYGAEWDLAAAGYETTW